MLPCSVVPAVAASVHSVDPYTVARLLIKTTLL